MLQHIRITALAALLSLVAALPTGQPADGVVLIGADGAALDGSSLLFNSSAIERDEPSLALRADPNFGFQCRPVPQPKSAQATCYIEKRSNERFGWQQKVTQEMHCTTTKGCKSESMYQYQATSTFTLSTGLGLDLAFARGAFAAGASANVGASWSWSTATTTGTTSGVELAEGERGYLAFWPRIHESCGILAITGLMPMPGKYAVPGQVQPWSNMPGQVNDHDACGIAPMYLSNGQADGIVKFCYTDGPRRGQGCEHPTIPGPPPADPILKKIG